MTTKTKQYAIQSLAACGFAVMRSTVAWQLRPDLWSSAQDCGVGFAKVEIEGTQRLNVTLAGIGDVPVLTRSLDRLAERIEWITGYKVLKIEVEQTGESAKKSAPTITEGQKKATERIEKTKALAVQELPTHDCSLRREILMARSEIARMSA